MRTIPPREPGRFTKVTHARGLAAFRIFYRGLRRYRVEGGEGDRNIGRRKRRQRGFCIAGRSRRLAANEAGEHSSSGDPGSNESANDRNHNASGRASLLAIAGLVAWITVRPSNESPGKAGGLLI